MASCSAQEDEHSRWLLSPPARQSTSQPLQPRGRRSTSRRCSQLAVNTSASICALTALVQLESQAEDVAATTASGRAVLVATERNSAQEGPNQQSARTRERRRCQHEACGQTRARVLPHEHGPHRDPETAARHNLMTCTQSRVSAHGSTAEIARRLWQWQPQPSGGADIYRCSRRFYSVDELARF